MTPGRSEFSRADTPKSPAVRVSIVDEKQNAPPAALSLEWRDITLERQAKPKKKTQAENAPPILSGVNGLAAPGELLVVMGPSGAGKSTLLNVLSGLVCTGLSRDSSVTINGQQLTTTTSHQHVAFLAPDDIFYESLTVREHLLFHARFRRPNMEQMCQQQVDRVIRDNSFDAVRDALIGELSAGQKKRLAITSKLLGDASIFLIDEPTLGLGDFEAVDVVSQLKDVATRGAKTVVAAITRPSSEVFMLFGKIILLAAGGKVVYHGPAATAVAYFGEHGYQCPRYYGAADYMLMKVSAGPSRSIGFPNGLPDGSSANHSQLEALVEAWETYRHSNAYAATLQAAVCTPADQAEYKPVQVPAARSPFDLGDTLYEFATLLRRMAARIVGDKSALRMTTVPPLVVSVLIGLICLQPNMDQRGLQTFSSVFFVFTAFQVMINARDQLASMPRELALVSRERQAGLYRIALWFLAKNVTELPLQIVQPIFVYLPAYFLVGIGHGADLFFYQLVILILVGSAGVGFGYMISCVARRTNAVMPIGFALLVPMFLLSGTLLNPKAIPDYWLWLAYLSPFKYGFEALMNLFWARVDTISCYPAVTCTSTSGAVVLIGRGLTDRTPWASGLLLVALNVGFRLIGLLSLLLMPNT